MLLNRTFGTDFNMLVASYNFKDDNLNWSKTSDGIWGKLLTRSYKEGTNDVTVIHGNKLDVYNASSGDMIKSFDVSSDIIEVYSYNTKNMYLTINEDSTANYISMETGNNVILKGQYEFNLDNYTLATKNKKGYLLVPKNENRVILYEANTNKDAKKVDVEFEYVKSDSIYENDVKKLKEKFNVKNQNLVSNMFYDEKKDRLFVSYADDSFAIYDVDTKELLNTVEGISRPDHYYGKDKYGRTYIGTISDAYILDKDYNKVGHIKGLAILEKDKVIISNNGDLYSLPIYTLNDLLNQAKIYLE